MDLEALKLSLLTRQETALFSIAALPGLEVIRLLADNHSKRGKDAVFFYVWGQSLNLKISAIIGQIRAVTYGYESSFLYYPVPIDGRRNGANPVARRGRRERPCLRQSRQTFIALDHHG